MLRFDPTHIPPHHSIYQSPWRSNLDSCSNKSDWLYFSNSTNNFPKMVIKIFFMNFTWHFCNELEFPPRASLNFQNILKWLIRHWTPSLPWSLFPRCPTTSTTKYLLQVQKFEASWSPSKSCLGSQSDKVRPMRRRLSRSKFCSTRKRF